MNKGNQILRQLNTLNRAELEEVIRYAKALKNNPGLAVSAAVNTTRGTDEYDWILGECANVCRAQGLSMMDVEALKASRLYKAGFRVPIPSVHAYIETFAKGRLLQRAVYRQVYGHMVLRYRWGPTRMVASTTQIPRLLDEMLPGYHHAGLMEMAIQRLEYEQDRKS